MSGLLVAVALTSCKRKPPPPAAPVLSDVQANNRSDNPIGKLFQPSGVGSRVFIRTTNDALIAGQVKGIFVDHVALSVSNKVQDIRREAIQPHYRAQFYVEDFIAQETQRRPPFDATKPLTVLGLRFAAEDDQPLRSGPGPNYQPSDAGALLKGTPLQVVEEDGEWILVASRDPGPNRQTGWMYRFLTTPLDPMDASGQEKEIAVLQQTGWLDRVDPVASEAYVKPNRWQESDVTTREGISRALALYCKQAGPKHLSRVDVLDAESGHRLAKYSESLGYKAF